MLNCTSLQDLRAEAIGFETKACSRTDPTPDVSSLYRRRSSARVRPEIVTAHPVLAELTDGLPIATRLAATLTPEQMMSDVVIGWRRYSRVRRIPFTMGAAAARATLFMAGVVLIASLGGTVLMRRRPAWATGSANRRLILGVVGIGVVVWSSVLLATPVVELDGGGVHPVIVKSEHWHIQDVLQNLATDAVAGEPAVPDALRWGEDEAELDWLNRLARSVISSDQFNDYTVRTRAEIRAIDAPNGFTIRPAESGEGYEYVRYGYYGEEYPEPFEY